MMTNTFHEIFSSFRQWLKMLFWWEIEIVSIFDHENKGLEIDNDEKWNENNTQQHCLFHDQAMCSECRLSNLIIRMIGKHIVQPIVRINNIFIHSNGLPVHSKFLLIHSNGWANCSNNLFTCLNGLPVCSKFLLICSNGWPNRSNNSSVWTVRQTVQTLQGLLVNHSSSMRFCHLNGFPLVSVLP